jgi:ABC-type Fe3+-hydroxamate transport system substrate-binding protein
LKAGYRNVFATRQRYPQLHMEELAAAKPDLIFLSSEPFPFRQKHIDALQPQFPNTKIIIADGEMFSWYGSRMLYAPAYFQQLRLQVSSL